MYYPSEFPSSIRPAHCDSDALKYTVYHILRYLSLLPVSRATKQPYSYHFPVMSMKTCQDNPHVDDPSHTIYTLSSLEILPHKYRLILVITQLDRISRINTVSCYAISSTPTNLRANIWTNGYMMFGMMSIWWLRHMLTQHLRPVQTRPPAKKSYQSCFQPRLNTIYLV